MTGGHPGPPRRFSAPIPLVIKENVTIDGEEVFLDGEPCHNFLAGRIIEHFQEGFDVDNLTAFLSNLYRNPNEKIREQLFAYLEKGRNPITTDGKFWAFKKVRHDDYSSHHGKNGPVLHALGTVVEMLREECHQDETAMCVAGLHFCSRDYLSEFWGGRGRILIVEVDPADVTGIPSDYNRTKGRTCRYRVVGELDNEGQVKDSLNELAITAVVQSESEPEEDEPVGYLVPCSTLTTGADVYEAEVEAAPDQEPTAHADLSIAISLSGTIEEGTPVSVLADSIREITVGALTLAFEDSEAGHPVSITKVDDEDGSHAEIIVKVIEPEVPEPVNMMFGYQDRTFDDWFVTDEVNRLGQRGFAREYGVPRTTVQEWLKRI